MPKTKLIRGDCVQAMRDAAVRGVQVQAIVTDPPYELKFMGKGWDETGIAFDPETWRACFDLLPPGGHLVAFSSPRTYHRMACAIEDAGFEVRDQIMWLYGSGFPKSHDVGKKLEDWQGWGTALKPAHEPIVLARKPLEGTVAQNVLGHGTGAINVDACRVESDGSHKRPYQPTNNERSVFGKQTGFQPTNHEGRWPANVCHDGSEEVEGEFAKFGQLRARGNKTAKTHVRADSVVNYASKICVEYGNPGDKGSASRFFYCAKASKKERQGSKHPTVKPVALMRWLVRMVTPPGGVVMDPFAGTGTTGEAAYREGFDCVMIEMTEDYWLDIQARIKAVREEGQGTEPDQGVRKRKRPK